ncbi:hypothetical protein CWI39_0337p0050 [Hamiltosporidium magnivora]|uniref:Uncharacterized protein n=1 Tax=Hamiltosporidium magnivora TaxID=148818 RepID=A0A4Q9LJ58_9MICR|nr:hypothetical protein CWI39_0337p0050 [Hamiltosporidium magnivora]
MRYEYGNIIINLIIYGFKVNTKKAARIIQEDSKPFEIQCKCISEEEAEKEKKRIAEEENKKKGESKEDKEAGVKEGSKEGGKEEDNEAIDDATVGEKDAAMSNKEGTSEGANCTKNKENKADKPKDKDEDTNKDKKDEESKNKFLKITKTYGGSSKDSVVSLSNFINAVQNLKFKENCSITSKGWFKITLLGSKPYSLEVQPFKNISPKDIQIKDTIKIEFSQFGKLSIKISNKDSFNETVESKIGKEIFEVINGL